MNLLQGLCSTIIFKLCEIFSPNFLLLWINSEIIVSTSIQSVVYYIKCINVPSRSNTFPRPTFKLLRIHHKTTALFDTCQLQSIVPFMVWYGNQFFHSCKQWLANYKNGVEIHKNFLRQIRKIFIT
jgi:hypothetical protein